MRGASSGAANSPPGGSAGATAGRPLKYASAPPLGFTRAPSARSRRPVGTPAKARVSASTARDL